MSNCVLEKESKKTKTVLRRTLNKMKRHVIRNVYQGHARLDTKPDRKVKKKTQTHQKPKYTQHFSALSFETCFENHFVLSSGWRTYSKSEEVKHVGPRACLLKGPLDFVNSSVVTAVLSLSRSVDACVVQGCLALR